MLTLGRIGGGVGVAAVVLPSFIFDGTTPTNLPDV